MKKKNSPLFPPYGPPWSRIESLLRIKSIESSILNIYRSFSRKYLNTFGAYIVTFMLNADIPLYYGYSLRRMSLLIIVVTFSLDTCSQNIYCWLSWAIYRSANSFKVMFKVFWHTLHSYKYSLSSIAKQDIVYITEFTFEIGFTMLFYDNHDPSKKGLYLHLFDSALNWLQVGWTLLMNHWR